MDPTQKEVRQNDVHWMYRFDTSVYVVPRMYSLTCAYMCYTDWKVQCLHDSCMFLHSFSPMSQVNCVMFMYVFLLNPKNAYFPCLCKLFNVQNECCLFKWLLNTMLVLWSVTALTFMTGLYVSYWNAFFFSLSLNW